MPENHAPVTLMLHDSHGLPWPVRMSADCAQFVGRYARLAGFGPRGALIDFLSGDGVQIHR